MNKGTVKWFNGQRGFGFIQLDDGSKDVFVHISAVESAGMHGLNEGHRQFYSTLLQIEGPASRPHKTCALPKAARGSPALTADGPAIDRAPRACSASHGVFSERGGANGNSFERPYDEGGNEGGTRAGRGAGHARIRG